MTEIIKPTVVLIPSLMQRQLTTDIYCWRMGMLKHLMTFPHVALNNNPFALFSLLVYNLSQ